jgi:hypothetical protein
LTGAKESFGPCGKPPTMTEFGNEREEGGIYIKFDVDLA